VSYEEYYSLHDQPFLNSPDNRFFFNSHQHQEAMTRIFHAINTRKGLAVLLGDVGTGKTTLGRRMLQDLPPDKYQATLLIIIHTSISREWLLRKIASQMGVADVSTDRDELMSQLIRRLEEIEQQGRKAVILVDEANMLQSKEIMEELRGLLNLEGPLGKLISFVLIGLPDLDDHIAQDAPFKQRTAVRFTLHSLQPTVMRQYIIHRLKVAGTEDPLFSDDAYDAIYNFSNGIPRLINTICDNALLEGYLTKRTQIDSDLIEDVVVGLGI
jgi:general secretion pathway protein A